MSLDLEITSLEIENIDAVLTDLKNAKTELKQKLKDVEKAIQSLEVVKLAKGGRKVSSQFLGIKKAYGGLKQQIIVVLGEWGPIGNKEIFEKISQNNYQTTQTNVNSTLHQYTKRGEFIKIGRGLYNLANNSK